MDASVKSRWTSVKRREHKMKRRKGEGKGRRESKYEKKTQRLLRYPFPHRD